MIILSHRGLWKTPNERNTRAAFVHSFDAGFGTETDLRDICGKIVISHDMPHGDEITFEEVLQIMDGRNLPLALNIKADGQAARIQELLAKYNHTNYFTFDMSIPDMVVQMDAGLNVFTGFSDILPTPVLLDRASGVWLDSFNSDWWDDSDIQNLINKNKSVCIVSSDLHKRDTSFQWENVKKLGAFESKNLMLCTDKPLTAKEYFYDKN